MVTRLGDHFSANPKFCECSLDRIGLRMAVPLSDRDLTVPSDFRKGERVTVRSHSGQRGVPHHVRLKRHQQEGKAMFNRLCIRSTLT